MAHLIKVLAELGPKLVLGRTTKLEEISEWVANRSSLNQTEVQRVLNELYHVIVFYSRLGRPVRLPGLGRVRAAMSRHGVVRVHVTPDRLMVQAMNQKGTYNGDVVNRGNIGLTDLELKAIWDARHPDDPMDLRSGSGVGEPPIEPIEPGEPEPGGGGVEPPEPEPGEPGPEPEPPGV